MSQSYTILDDRDPSVQYTGSWTVGGTTHEYEGTVSSSLTPGDHFVVPFAGVRVAVYGTHDVSSGGVSTSYSIDGGSAQIVDSSASSGSDVYQQVFWQSGQLSSGSHQLTVKMLTVNVPNDDGEGEGTIWFDFFNVTEPSITSPVAPSSPSSAASPPLSSPPLSSPSSPASNNTQSASITGTSAAVSSTSSGSSVMVVPKSSNAGLIGGLVAAIFVILAITGVLLVLRRRRRQIFSSMTGQASATPPPMSGVAAAMPALYGGAYAEPYASGGFDARATYATRIASMPTPDAGYAYESTREKGSNDYDPYLAITASMPSHKASEKVPSSDESSSTLPSGKSPSTSPSTSPTPYVYAASTASSTPSSSTTSGSRRGPVAVGSSGGASSYANLKRRQQEVVDSYEQGLSGREPPVQHADSGLRGPLAPQRTGGTELPPIYTPD